MTRPKTHLPKPKSAFNRRRSIPVIAAVVFAGAVIVWASLAATAPVAFESESGVVIAPATTPALTGASGSKVVKFGPATATPAPTPASPSGVAMHIGDLPGWKQIVAQDFDTTAPSGSFVNTYTNNWCPYNDAQAGYYLSTLSAHDGLMDISLDGTKGAGGAFGIHTAQNYCGTLYGRYSIRFKVTGAIGYGTAMMVWPNSNIWADGEIDYPEGEFDRTMHINHHTMIPAKCATAPGCNETDYSLDTGIGFQAWHTATTEWLPDRVNYYLDGALLHSVTTSVPSTNHRMTIQMRPHVTPAASGHFLVDWVTIYAQQ